MQYTESKALVRTYFYLEFLPRYLSSVLVRGGNYLVLLGEEDYEVALLDELGVPLYRIYSVENDSRIATEQARRARRGELDVVLYFGELAEYLEHHLQTNQRFQVLNLDIYGAYLTHIDPQMTNVLCFARRNPRTVVATYSNGARDRPQLGEGLKSLALCRWLAPERTDQAVQRLYGRYRAAGLTESVSFNMVLRHFFWVRSHLEHTALSALAAGRCSVVRVQVILDRLNRYWKTVVHELGPSVSYQQLLEAADRPNRPRASEKVFDLQPRVVSTATYQAANGFYHLGWFALYERTQAVTAADWLESTFAAVLAEPLRYAKLEDTTLASFDDGPETVDADQVIWQGNLPQPGRQLELPSGGWQLDTFDEPVAEPATVVAEPLDPIPLIRELAQQGLNTDEVQERLAAQPQFESLPRRTITAHIALARRQHDS